MVGADHFYVGLDNSEAGLTAVGIGVWSDFDQSWLESIAHAGPVSTDVGPNAPVSAKLGPESTKLEPVSARRALTSANKV